MPILMPNIDFASVDNTAYLDEFVSRLSQFKKKQSPPKPVELPNDATLIGIVARSQTERGVTRQDEREILELYGAWRAMVYACEDECGARLLTLFCFIKQEEERSYGLTDDSRMVRQFVRNEYGRWPPRVMTETVMRYDPSAFAMDMDLMSGKLRRGDER